MSTSPVHSVSECEVIDPKAAPVIRGPLLSFRRRHKEGCDLSGTIADSDCSSTKKPARVQIAVHNTLRPICDCMTAEENNLCILLNLIAKEKYFEAYFTLWKLICLGYVDREDVRHNPCYYEICYKVWYTHKFYFRLAELDSQTNECLRVIPILEKHLNILENLPKYKVPERELFKAPNSSLVEENLKKEKGRKSTLYLPYEFSDQHHPQFVDYATQMSNPETFKTLYHKTTTGKRFPLAFGNSWKSVVNDELRFSKKSEPRIKVWVNSNKRGTTWMTTRVEVLLACPFLQVLSLCCELRLLARWIPYYKRPFRCGVSKVDQENLCKFSRCGKAAGMTVDVPWPFKNRYVCMEASMVHDFSNARLNFLQRSYDKEHLVPLLGCEIPECPKNSFSASVFGALTLIPTGPNNSQTIVQGLLDFDMKVKIPDAFIGWFAGVFARKALIEFNKACQDANLTGSATEECRKNDGWLFEFMKRELDKYELSPKLDTVSE